MSFLSSFNQKTQRRRSVNVTTVNSSVNIADAITIKSTTAATYTVMHLVTASAGNQIPISSAFNYVDGER
ncbi:unnamed protein product [Cochlearia groenlandica]